MTAPHAYEHATDPVAFGTVPTARMDRRCLAWRALEWPWPEEYEPGETDGDKAAAYSALYLALDAVARRWATYRYGPRAPSATARLRLIAGVGRYRAEPRRLSAYALEYWRARRWLLGQDGGDVVAGPRSLGYVACIIGIDVLALARRLRQASL